MTTKLLSCALTALLGATLPHISPAQPAANIPVRQVAVVAATDSGVILGTFALRVLSNEFVLHSDPVRHRLALLDASLHLKKIVADSTTHAISLPGSGLGNLLAFAGDSTVLVDRASESLIVLDRDGRIGRVMASPKAADLEYFAGTQFGVPAFDQGGRMYYRATLPTRRLTWPPGNDTVKMRRDSAPIVRADFESRRIDTLAMVRILEEHDLYFRGNDGRNRSIHVVNPLPVLDAWAVLPNGTVAIIRGQDYHMDWVDGNGKLEATPKMAFDWRRLTEEAKQQRLDSAQHLLDSVRVLRETEQRRRGTNSELGSLPVTALVSLGELPDYFPPLLFGAPSRVDQDGRVWIVPSTSSSIGNGLLIDVVDRSGGIIERVRLPVGRKLEGFGSDGTLFLSVPSQAGYPRLERARVLR